MKRRNKTRQLFVVLFLAALFIAVLWLFPSSQQPPSKVYYAARDTNHNIAGAVVSTGPPAMPELPPPNELPDGTLESTPESVGANPPPLSNDYGKIAVILDDMGVDLRNSAEAIQLPPEITLSYLPYALRLVTQTREAREHGHILMLHMPMSPVGKEDPGPYALRSGMDLSDAHAELLKAMASFGGYVGLNNHMGSQATTDLSLMQMVAQELRQRGLFFVDSRTTAKSVAADVMRQYGVPVLTRNVFLDDEITEKFIRQQLGETEAIALRRGSVVVIGHPHALTLALLRSWIPTLSSKQLQLVPVTELLK